MDFLLIWLRQILVMALRILVASCGSFCCVTETLAGVMWAAVVEVGELSSWGTRAPEWGSAVWQSCGLSSSAMCGILVPRLGIQPVSPTLQGRFVTAGPPRKSLNAFFFFKEWLTNYQCSWPLKKWGPWAPIPIHHHTSSGKSLYSFIVSTRSAVLHFWIQSTADHIALYLLLKKFHVQSIHAVQTRVVQRSAVNSNILISTVFIFFWGSFQYILT